MCFMYGDFPGYALTSGAYFEQEDILYASGVTRGADLHGKVFVFNFPLTSIKHIQIKTKVEGEQVGEYFGAALTSCDINNDGKDELIVGAPQWTKDMDEGRVYIFTTQHGVRVTYIADNKDRVVQIYREISRNSNETNFIISLTEDSNV